jgi:hypothetical protein
MQFSDQSRTFGSLDSRILAERGMYFPGMTDNEDPNGTGLYQAFERRSSYSESMGLMLTLWTAGWTEKVEAEANSNFRNSACQNNQYPFRATIIP